MHRGGAALAQTTASGTAAGAVTIMRATAPPRLSRISRSVLSLNSDCSCCSTDGYVLRLCCAFKKRVLVDNARRVSAHPHAHAARASRGAAPGEGGAGAFAQAANAVDGVAPDLGLAVLQRPQEQVAEVLRKRQHAALQARRDLGAGADGHGPLGDRPRRFLRHTLTTPATGANDQRARAVIARTARGPRRT